MLLSSGAPLSFYLIWVVPRSGFHFNGTYPKYLDVSETCRYLPQTEGLELRDDHILQHFQNHIVPFL
jgi:hypothetical protein